MQISAKHAKTCVQRLHVPTELPFLHATVAGWVTPGYLPAMRVPKPLMKERKKTIPVRVWKVSGLMMKLISWKGEEGGREREVLNGGTTQSSPVMLHKIGQRNSFKKKHLIPRICEEKISRKQSHLGICSRKERKKNGWERKLIALPVSSQEKKEREKNPERKREMTSSS